MDSLLPLFKRPTFYFEKYISVCEHLNNIFSIFILQRHECGAFCFGLKEERKWPLGCYDMGWFDERLSKFFTDQFWSKNWNTSEGSRTTSPLVDPDWSFQNQYQSVLCEFQISVLSLLWVQNWSCDCSHDDEPWTIPAVHMAIKCGWVSLSLVFPLLLLLPLWSKPIVHLVLEDCGTYQQCRKGIYLTSWRLRISHDASGS